MHKNYIVIIKGMNEVINFGEFRDEQYEQVRDIALKDFDSRKDVMLDILVKDDYTLSIDTVWL